MSLIDKLDVHIGDLILLKTENSELEVTGFVKDYSPKKVKLKQRNPKIFNKGRGLNFWQRIHFLRDDPQTYKLKYFDKYKILKQEPQ